MVCVCVCVCACIHNNADAAVSSAFVCEDLNLITSNTQTQTHTHTHHRRNTHSNTPRRNTHTQLSTRTHTHTGIKKKKKLENILQITPDSAGYTNIYTTRDLSIYAIDTLIPALSEFLKVFIITLCVCTPRIFNMHETPPVPLIWGGTCVCVLFVPVAVMLLWKTLTHLDTDSSKYDTHKA
eukprot:GHVR01150966.1.p1 GENE.GHVR01150966.1~~GHVR01150966.1.p1  ORF type:complete len:181 (+),score=91.51 GHVR01150966.1:68-610(+)